MVTFSATGIGSPTEDGGNSWKGVTYFETSAPSLVNLMENALFTIGMLTHRALQYGTFEYS